jgi:hypothetical protein
LLSIQINSTILDLSINYFLLGVKNMGIEALGLAAGAAEGFVEGYFYDKKVDKLSTAVEKVMANAHDRARSLMADGFFQD